MLWLFVTEYPYCYLPSFSIEMDLFQAYFMGGISVVLPVTGISCVLMNFMVTIVSAAHGLKTSQLFSLQYSQSGVNMPLLSESFPGKSISGNETSGRGI